MSKAPELSADVAKRLTLAKSLVERLRQLQAQTDEVVEELTKIMAGDVAIGDQLMKDFESHFSMLWQNVYVSTFVWQYARDRPHTKRLLKLLGVEELKSRACNYLRDPDPFYAKARHPFGLFITNINRFATQSNTTDFELAAPPVADCAHHPRCRSDQEHTTRQLADLRGAWHGAQ